MKDDAKEDRVPVSSPCEQVSGFTPETLGCKIPSYTVASAVVEVRLGSIKTLKTKPCTTAEVLTLA